MLRLPTVGLPFWLTFALALSAGTKWQAAHTYDVDWPGLLLLGVLLWGGPSLIAAFSVQLFVDLAQCILGKQRHGKDALATAAMLLFSLGVGALVLVLPLSPV
jgi:hypothetical protein